MKLVIDIRESALIENCKKNTQHFKTVCIETENLPIGDIWMKTEEQREILIIERKTFQDLFASIKDGRYEEQSHRLLHSSGMPPHNIVYLIEGMMSQIDHSQRKLLYSTIASLNVFKGFSVLRSSTVQESADLLMSMADKIDRDFMKGRIPAYLRTFSVADDGIDHENDPPEIATATSTAMVRLPQETLANTTFEEMETGVPSASSYSTFVKRVKRDNITNDNIGEIMLCQIPGISTKSASVIMKKVDGKMSTLIRELEKDSQFLKDVVLENGRKMNAKISNQICEYLL